MLPCHTWDADLLLGVVIKSGAVIKVAPHCSVLMSKALINADVRHLLHAHCLCRTRAAHNYILGPNHLTVCQGEM